jgi:hypothetical protein
VQVFVFGGDDEVGVVGCAGGDGEAGALGPGGERAVGQPQLPCCRLGDPLVLVVERATATRTRDQGAGRRNT